MRPVSGDDLVTAALQSSLARAQKNYKLSNYKQLGKSSGKKFVKNAVGVGEAVGKSKSLKFQSEFDLWIEQAQGFSFVTEGYTNGATVPEDIECLNSSGGSVKGRKQNSRSESTLQKNKKKVFGENSSELGTPGKQKEQLVINGDTSSVLKGKNKLKTTDAPVENSFEIIRKFNESKKLKKKLLKWRKNLQRLGYSSVEVQKLITKAQSGGDGPGAILRKLGTVVPQDKKENTELLPQLVRKNKNLKMKDPSTDIGESSTSVSRQDSSQAHSSHPHASSSASTSSPRVNGSNNASSSNSPGNNQHQLPQPKRVLYPREKIVPGYMEKMPVGAGFYNMGNSCYLNASLQAVFHVPAFINWLRHDSEHRRHCQDSSKYRVSHCKLRH